MYNEKNTIILGLFCWLLFLPACAMIDATGTTQTQVQQRSYQSKVFDTIDKNNVLRNVIVLQCKI